MRFLAGFPWPSESQGTDWEGFLSVGRIDEKTRRMLNKLKMRGVPSVLQLDGEIKSLENQIKKYEQNNFHQAIDRWKHSMRYDQTANSHWLTRKKIAYYPSVERINLIRKLASKDGSTFSFAIGAPMSAKVKSMAFCAVMLPCLSP